MQFSRTRLSEVLHVEASKVEGAVIGEVLAKGRTPIEVRA